MPWEEGGSGKPTPREWSKTCDILVLGLGRTGRAAAESARLADPALDVLGVDKQPSPSAAPGIARLQPAFAIDLVHDRNEVRGALVLAEGRFELVGAKVVVLATGGLRGLRTSAPQTGDGLAMASRAGVAVDWAAARITVDPDPSAQSREGEAGRTSMRNLFAAGEVAGQADERAEAAGREVGAQAARAAGGLRTPLVPSRLPLRAEVDSPLPAGFAEPKWARLRDLVTLATREPAAAMPGLLRLKGEADDFARGRPDPELYALQNACEVALALARAKGAISE